MAGSVDVLKTSDFLSYLTAFAWIYISAFHQCLTSATSGIKATAPINPVPEGGMLAFHCRIHNLERSHDVAISKTHGADCLRISYHDKILVGDDSRYFLAVRQLSDASVVYFLTITDVSRSDGGQYSCKVLDMGGEVVREVGKDRVQIHVSYLPSDNFPVCASGPLTMQSGSLVRFNCSSELGSPNVTVAWSRTGDGVVFKATDYYSDNFVTSVLTLKPSVKDTHTMLVCTIKNKVLPDVKTCHIGPITITRNPNDLTRHSQDVLRPVRITEAPVLRNPNVNVKSEYCKELCEEQESSLFIWMISTVIAACVAFVLFILGIMLCIKIRYKTVEPPQQFMREDLYAELDKRFEEDAVYMALDRSESEKVYNAYNQTLPRRAGEHVGYGNVPTGNTSL